MNNKRIKRSAVAFPDANLEVAIRKAINKPEGPIYASDLEPLTELDLLGNNISDISSLISLTNLQELNLNSNNISDILPLAGLNNLQMLDLNKNNISDISPLAGLTNLEWLFLEENNISDISALAELSNIKVLILKSNNISDISVLVENSGLSKGDAVDLSFNPLNDTSTDVYIPQLEARGVFVESRFAGDWSFGPRGGSGSDAIFPRADRLMRLEPVNEVIIRLDINKPRGLIYASDLEPLTELDLAERDISDISPLAGLINLEDLNLNDNNISDISPLAGLTNLERLYLGANKISDISALAGLSNLEWLDLDYNNISDISALVENSGLSDGGTVDLSGNPLSATSIDVYIPQLRARGVTVESGKVA